MQTTNKTKNIFYSPTVMLPSSQPELVVARHTLGNCVIRYPQSWLSIERLHRFPRQCRLSSCAATHGYLQKITPPSF